MEWLADDVLIRVLRHAPTSWLAVRCVSRHFTRLVGTSAVARDLLRLIRFSMRHPHWPALHLAARHQVSFNSIWRTGWTWCYYNVFDLHDLHHNPKWQVAFESLVASFEVVTVVENQQSRTRHLPFNRTFCRSPSPNMIRALVRAPSLLHLDLDRTTFDDGGALLCTHLYEMPRLRTLNLSRCALYLAPFFVTMAGWVATHSSLDSLGLSANVAPEVIDEMVLRTFLRACARLVALDLSYNWIGHAWFLDELFHSIVPNSSLRHLAVSKCLSSQSSRLATSSLETLVLTNAFDVSLDVGDALRQLHVAHHNAHSTQLLDDLARSRLTTLSIETCPHADEVARLLTQCSRLTHLSLRSNTFDKEDAQVLARALRGLPLRVVDIADNPRLNNETPCALLETFATMTTLEYLDLSATSFYHVDGETIGRILAKNCAMRSLLLEDLVIPSFATHVLPVIRTHAAVFDVSYMHIIWRRRMHVAKGPIRLPAFRQHDVSYASRQREIVERNAAQTLFWNCMHDRSSVVHVD